MIEIRNLTKIYHTEEEGSLALNNVSIAFPETGFVTITGESGSGKTTLLNVLSGFLPYEEGDFFVDGVDFLSLSADELDEYRQNKIGFVFQDYHLIESHFVIDNLVEALQVIGVSIKEAESKSIEMLRLFDLYEQRKLRVRDLSSGQKQRLAIARAMIKEPSILLCDEPTGNLDVENGKKILEILKEYSKNHLVIISTHNYEDAKEYVTHFIRIYKGNLTNYFEVKNNEKKVDTSLEKRNINSFYLSLFAFKNHKFKTVVKTLVLSLFTFMFTFLLVLFAANIDEYSTRNVTKKIFNNVAPNEVLVMKKDGGYQSVEELEKLKSIRHISGTQLYGLATEMNYYYRENIDFEYEKIITKEEISSSGGGLPDIVENVEFVFSPISDKLHIKSYDGIISEDTLKEGTLPINYYDAVAGEGYNVGDIISVYFYDPVLQGYYTLKFDFTVSGVLPYQSDDLFFSNDFIREIDYIQYYSHNPKLRFGINYSIYDRYGAVSATRTDSFFLTPLYNPKLGDNEIQFSKAFIDKFEKSISKNFEYNNFFTYITGTSFDDRLINTLYEEKSTDELDAKYIYVGKNVVSYFISDYQSNTSRIIIDNYAYLDDVIKDLTNYKYDTLSAYRASSTEYNYNKQVQRAVILISSLVLTIVGALIAILIGVITERNEINDDKTLYLLGSNVKSLRKKSFYKIGLFTLISMVIGIALYLITYALPFTFIVEMNLYSRFYHFIIVIAISLLICLFSWLGYNKRLSKVLKKGVRN